MRMNHCHQGTLATLLLLTGCAVGHAQPPHPTPPPVSSEVRQKLRKAILDIATKEDPSHSNERLELALPLAKLGDWDGAMRLIRHDMYAPRHNDQLWHWRAYQLAHAGKWREVPALVVQLKSTDNRADVLLFAARAALDRGVVLGGPAPEAEDLRKLLLTASPLLDKVGRATQIAYSGYLWARAGDRTAARRLFARALEAHRRAQERLKAESRKDPMARFKADSRGHDKDTILSFMGHAGMIPEALQHVDGTDRFVLSGLLFNAKTSTDFDMLIRHVEKLSGVPRFDLLFQMAMLTAARGNNAQARSLYDAARKAADSPQAAGEKSRPNGKNPSGKLLAAYFAYQAVYFIGDAELKAQTFEELRAIATQEPAPQGEMGPAEIAALPALLELEGRRALGISNAPPTLEQLAVVMDILKAAPPSNMKFGGLERVAGYYLQHKRLEKIQPVARELVETARALAAAEMAERKKHTGTINPYWPRTPHMLSAIHWLQRAGDKESAAAYARQFALNLPQSERPYAAMSLIQLGYPKLADSVFDPVVEIPRSLEQQRRNWKTRKVDWSLFQSWDEFAGHEARYRAPDAPFRWYHKLGRADSRAQVLRNWVDALYPEPGQQSPYVLVTSSGSRGSY